MTGPIDTTSDTPSTCKVLDAAILCLEQLGLDKATMEDIARLSSVSRATLYRRFGSREAIFAAALDRHSRPFERQASDVLNGLGTLPERIERFVLWAVLDVPANRLLQNAAWSGLSDSGMQVFGGVFKRKIGRILMPLIDAAKISRELPTLLDAEALIDWLIRELLMIKSTQSWERNRLQRYIRNFIIPVLHAHLAPIAHGAGLPARSMEQRLAHLENRLTEIHQLLGLVHQDIHALSI